jgi:hypothetical protein
MINMNEMRELLFSRGISDSLVEAELTLLCDMGYLDEVQCLIWEFENEVFEGQVVAF